MVDANEAALVADLKQLAADVETLAQAIKKAGAVGQCACRRSQID
jgi:hypothetical protein